MKSSKVWIAPILLCFAFFLYRGPMRSQHSADFAAPYVASARLFSHVNPYESAHFLRDWERMGGNARKTQIDQPGQRPVYPPTTLVLVAPWTTMPWYPALAALVWIEAALYLGLIHELSKEFSVRQVHRKYLFWCLSLLLASTQTCLFTGNISLLAFLACAFGTLLSMRRIEYVGGLLVAVGCGLKPTIGFTLILFLFAMRRLKDLGAFAATFGVLGAVSLFEVSRTGSEWLASYRSNVAYLFNGGGIASYLPANSTNYELLNLQFPMYTLVHNQIAAHLLAYGITCLLGGWWVYVFFRYRPVVWYQALAPIAILCLLPVYQRNYNGVFMVLVLLAILARNVKVSKGELAMVLPFLLPYQALLGEHLARHLSHRFTESFFWQFAVLPLQTWLILAFAILFIQRMRWGLPSMEAKLEEEIASVYTYG